VIANRPDEGGTAMGNWTFDVPGPLVGAVRTTQAMARFDPRYKKYHAFKDHVRWLANGAGVPQDLDADGSYTVTLEVWWKVRQRIDADNLLKSALDAMWPQDRRALQLHYWAYECYGEERMRVKVERVI
jgi:Holliday junction resolvase RusA-like endonuclease